MVRAVVGTGMSTDVRATRICVAGVSRTLRIVTVPSTPMPVQTDAVVTQDFADETSVVQTRFATTALTLLRASVGHQVDQAIEDCARMLQADLPPEALSAEQITFLGTGWTIGLAHEAALKNREASQAWTESYPAMDYRHGPIAIAGPNRLTWNFGPAPAGLAAQVEQTGATFRAEEGIDPLADLVLAQRVALERARQLGLDADTPRGLTRSVILDDD